MISRRHIFSRALTALSFAVLSLLMFHTSFSSSPILSSVKTHLPSLHQDHSDKESRQARKLREGTIDEWERDEETSQPVPTE
ncbi:MAG: hypothetical protein II014_02620 [Bifidobacteriaceae bacterium]|nr:hypothetical protein [Aeriscardovia sp.]MBQ1299124.1 hypothetical protein [Aeriscardovia sp.]MBQ1804138.1 hypothetical protein [Bifidobacteriaceae bacterium]